MKKMFGKVLLATLLGGSLFSAAASAQYGPGFRRPIYPRFAPPPIVRQPLYRPIYPRFAPPPVRVNPYYAPRYGYYGPQVYYPGGFYYSNGFVSYGFQF